MIPIDEELRHDGPIPSRQIPPIGPTLEYQEASWLLRIRERREEHRSLIAEWKRAIAEHNGRHADWCMSYAADLRRLVHSHAGNVRIVRQRMKQRERTDG